MTTAPPNRTVDAIIAALLGIVATAVVVATNDMGFVRDEAFYFGHAETYQDWQVRVESGGHEAEKALTRKEILETWHNNAEHPPLDKWLFGWSWRALGRKLRPIERLRIEAQQPRADLTGLGPAQGFAVGAWMWSFSLWLAWKVTTRRASMAMASPVRGLRPGRGALVRI